MSPTSAAPKPAAASGAPTHHAPADQSARLLCDFVTLAGIDPAGPLIVTDLDHLLEREMGLAHRVGMKILRFGDALRERAPVQRHTGTPRISMQSRHTCAPAGLREQRVYGVTR